MMYENIQNSQYAWHTVKVWLRRLCPTTSRGRGHDHGARQETTCVGTEMEDVYRCLQGTWATERREESRSEEATA